MRLLRPEAMQLLAHDAWRRLTGERPLPAGPIQGVVFVCHGNLCRSPFAAALLSERSPGLRVTSCGIAAAGGKPADPVARRHARRYGVDLSEHRTRRAAPEILDDANLILAMDAVQARLLAQRFATASPRIRVLGDSLDSGPYAIPDPWSQPDPVWHRVFDRIAAAVERLRRRLEAQP